MSQNRQFVAILQEDGNFVVYNKDKSGQASFATGTNNGRANQVQLRNATLRSSTNPTRRIRFGRAAGTRTEVTVSSSCRTMGIWLVTRERTIQAPVMLIFPLGIWICKTRIEAYHIFIYVYLYHIVSTQNLNPPPP